MKSFNDVSIKSRLWLIMGFMALLMLTGGGIGLAGIVKADEALESAYRDSLEPSGMISRVMLLMDENRAQIMLALQHDQGNPLAAMHDDPLVAHTSAIEKNRDEITAIVVEFKKRNLTAKEQVLADRYAAARARYVSEGLTPAVAALHAADYKTANGLLLQIITPTYEAASADAAALLQEILETAKAQYGEAVGRYGLIRNALVGSTALGMVLAAIAAMLLIRSIVRPLDAAVGHFKEIAQGNLTQTIAVSGKDEVGQVLSELAAMQEKLKTVIGELDLLARIDKLTGTWNRRWLEETVKSELDRLRRYAHPLSLVVFDIDFFKTVNDRHGHAVGDRVLAELSAQIRATLRSSDSLTRWGGDEFVLLCPNTTLSGVTVLAERLRKQIDGATFGASANITVSLGVAECLPGEIWEQWFHRADAALYRAKAGGRNQVQRAPELPHRAIAGQNVAAGFVQLVWNKAYECGNEVIDREHQRLFGDANELISAMLSGRPVDEIDALIGTLTLDVVRHFESEEAILVAQGYPGAAAHAANHLELVDGVVKMVDRFHAGTLGFGELFAFLAHDVVARHMLGADREFFPHLEARRSA